jgi:hypothetical protein
MKYSKKDINFILYNNRSSELVKKFIPRNFDPFRIIEIENIINRVQQSLLDLTSPIEIELKELILDSVDILFEKSDLEKWTDFIKANLGKFSEKEREFLEKRGVPINVQSGLIGLSLFPKESHIEIGATCHPMLSKILLDGLEGGGIVFPHWTNDKLSNIAIRKCDDIGKLKYTLAIPDLPVWGIDDINEGDEVWICEGIFDMLALQERGIKAVSVSSAMWSSLQLYQILDKKPGCIVLVSDNDRIGYMVALKLSKIFNIFKIPNLTIHTTKGKDMSEYFWELGGNGEDLEHINITRDLIGKSPDNSFNIINYWMNRKF